MYELGLLNRKLERFARSIVALVITRSSRDRRMRVAAINDESIREIPEMLERSGVIDAVFEAMENAREKMKSKMYRYRAEPYYDELIRNYDDFNDFIENKAAARKRISTVMTKGVLRGLSKVFKAVIPEYADVEDLMQDMGLVFYKNLRPEIEMELPTRIERNLDNALKTVATGGKNGFLNLDDFLDYVGKMANFGVTKAAEILKSEMDNRSELPSYDETRVTDGSVPNAMFERFIESHDMKRVVDDFFDYLHSAGEQVLGGVNVSSALWHMFLDNAENNDGEFTRGAFVLTGDIVDNLIGLSRENPQIALGLTYQRGDKAGQFMADKSLLSAYIRVKIMPLIMEKMPKIIIAAKDSLVAKYPELSEIFDDNDLTTAVKNLIEAGKIQRGGGLEWKHKQTNRDNRALRLKRTREEVYGGNRTSSYRRVARLSAELMRIARVVEGIL